MDKLSIIVRIRQSRRRLLMFCLSAIGVGTAAAAGFGPRRATTRPCPQPGLPPWNYQSGSTSPTVYFDSLPALPIVRAARTLIEASDAERQPTAGKLFQFPQPSLPIDHCSLNNMTVQVFADGTYIISLRADQNPQFVPLDRRAAPPPPSTVEADGVDRQLTRTEVGPFEHLLRNEFHVECLLLGVAQGTGTGDAPPNVPVLYKLKLPSFWVQRGKPEDVYVTGCLATTPLYFDLIQGARLRFCYR